MLTRLALLLFGQVLFNRMSVLLDALGLPLAARLALYAFIGACGLVLSIWIWQESILYVPGIPNAANPFFGSNVKTPQECPEGLRSPRERGLPFEDVKLVASDGVKCHAWFLPAQERATAPTVLFSHENAGSMSLRLPLFQVLHSYLHVNVFCYDYRGYGNSDAAAINEQGLLRDAHAAWRWLVQAAGVDSSRIVLFGSSLGGAVTIQLARDLCQAAADAAVEAPSGGAAEAPLPLGVVLQNTFISIEAMLGAKFPWLDWAFVRRHLLRLHWCSIEHIAHVSVPLLFIIGQRDEIVPPHHSGSLQQAAAAAPLIHVRKVPDGMHNDTWIKAGPDFVRWLGDFIRTAEASPSRW